MMSDLVMTHCPNCPKGRAFPNSLRWRKIDVGSDFTGKQGLIQAIEVYCQNRRCTLSVTPILK